MPRRLADLKFLPGSSSGFTPVANSAFDDLRPAIFVRELIQNSLDASIMAKNEIAKVHFRLSNVRKTDIPGIDSYETAFKNACKAQTQWSQGKLPRQAKLVVDRITAALEREEVEVLTVLDNGVGFDQGRMDAILSDGVSVKDDAATGTFGNGHATVFPASDLRYVLYVGLAADGRKIGSGRAVLASHRVKGKKHTLSGEGVFIRGFSNDESTLYSYPNKNDLNGVMQDSLKQIKTHLNHSHGSAIVVLAFNNFRENDCLWEMISRAAASNFFSAIEDRKLEVTFADCRMPTEQIEYTPLNRATLSKVLERQREENRAKSLLSGNRAYEAHRTYQLGKSQSIDTGCGVIGIHLLANTTDATRVDLCRNGMWIANERKIRKFRQSFSHVEPFHAVLSLNADQGGKFHEQIRLAETPLHDNILLKNLPSKDRKECGNAINKVVEWICNNVPRVKTEAFEPLDFLSFLTNENGIIESHGPAGRVQKTWGSPKTVDRLFDRRGGYESGADANDGKSERSGGGNKGQRPEGDSPKGQSSKSRRRFPDLPTRFNITTIPLGSDRRHIVIKCLKDFFQAELSLVVDEALDATCRRHNQDKYEPAVLTEVKIGGEAVTGDRLRSHNGKTIAVMLGDLKKGETLDLNCRFTLIGDFANITHPVLRVEIGRSEPAKADKLYRPTAKIGQLS